MTDGFFDQVARTLAEPMPRRRAVRVIGVSIAALAVPGVSPRLAAGAASTSSQFECNKQGQPVCSFINQDRSPGPSYCCPYPPQQWECSSNHQVKKCINSCPPKANLGFKTVNQKPTWSNETDAGGRPLRYKCCVVPDTIPKDGECLPNCPYQARFSGAAGPVPCGKTCCATYQLCVNGECQPCERYGGHSCQPYGGGVVTCCPKGTNCCANNKTTACCGPKQTCRAQGRKQATCVCERDRKKCGSDCCTKGETCCGGKECCSNGETCTAQGCCPKDRAMCVSPSGKDRVCCGEGEFCFWKEEAPDVYPLIGMCKKGCAPGNRAGKQCCGTGYKQNPTKTGCVKA